jgi:hypothetical protein
MSGKQWQASLLGSAKTFNWRGFLKPISVPESDVLPIVRPPSRREITKKVASATCNYFSGLRAFRQRRTAENRNRFGLASAYDLSRWWTQRRTVQRGGWDGEETFLADLEFAVAPADFLKEEARKPDQEGKGVAHREHPELAAALAKQLKAMAPQMDPDFNEFAGQLMEKNKL